MTSVIVIGAVTRTGLAIAVTLSGTVAAPRFLARREIELVPEGLPAQPYHAAADMDLAAGGELIARVQAAAENAAAAGLRALAGTGLAGTGPAGVVLAVAVVVKPVSVPGAPGARSRPERGCWAVPGGAGRYWAGPGRAGRGRGVLGGAEGSGTLACYAGPGAGLERGIA